MIKIKIFFILAAGLYYLAELVEEYTKYTAKVIKFLTVVSDWTYTNYGKMRNTIEQTRKRRKQMPKNL